MRLGWRVNPNTSPLYANTPLLFLLFSRVNPTVETCWKPKIYIHTYINKSIDIQIKRVACIYLCAYTYTYTYISELTRQQLGLKVT